MDEISSKIGEYISSATFEDLDIAAIDSAKKSTLDTLGAMIAGSTAPGIEIIVNMATSWGGNGQAHLIGFGDHLPAPIAVWCNASMGRALEIDDCLDFLPVHPSVSTIPCLLAIAELNGGLTGKDFLLSLAVGQDLITRLGLAVCKTFIQSGRNNMFKIFGPTAALAKAMGLNSVQAQNALGIAFSYAVGDGQCFKDGALSSRLQQGIVASGAFISALLSSKKFTGAKDFLLGTYGYLKAFEPNPRLEYLTKNLGKEFMGSQISIKPFSACRGTHASIDLALTFRKNMKPDVKKIERIRVFTSPEIYQLVGAPHDYKISPNSAPDAQFSIQFTVAAAILNGDFFLKELEQSSITDPRILNLAKRIYVEPDPSLRTESAVGRSVMKIDMKGFSPWEMEVETALGSPSHPIDYNYCVSKFMKCASYSANPIDNDRLNKLVDLVYRLEKIKDVSVLVSHLY